MKRCKNPSTRPKGSPSGLRMNSCSGIRVAVGMSGGVDSSVAALLLKDQGYDVVGFFMKLWHDPCGTGENACCDEKAQADARQVASKIGISFYVVDAREPFKKAVTDYFVEEYENARTPNPCLVCNKKIKFGWLLDFTKKNNCNYLATGHYARISAVDGVYKLLKPSDSNKDQTYFLSGLGQEQLAQIIFPLADLTKAEVRKIAEENGLPVYKKKESQEVCFVETNYRDFLKNNSKKVVPKRGEIIDQSGEIIGYHDGLINYTIGQRKGIDQTQNKKFNKRKETLYVIGMGLSNSQLIVGSQDDLYKKEMTVNNISMIDPKNDLLLLEDIAVKIRYRAKAIACKVARIDMGYQVYFQEHQRAVTPGQFAVFYQGDTILGNGKIVG